MGIAYHYQEIACGVFFHGRGGFLFLILSR
jgi:hypothetical protein